MKDHGKKWGIFLEHFFKVALFPSYGVWHYMRYTRRTKYLLNRSPAKGEIQEKSASMKHMFGHARKHILSQHFGTKHRRSLLYSPRWKITKKEWWIFLEKNFKVASVPSYGVRHYTRWTKSRLNKSPAKEEIQEKSASIKHMFGYSRKSMPAR